MGNQVIMEALRQLGSVSRANFVGELIFAAPDVDRDVFKQTASSLVSIAKGMTLYASSLDKALQVSKTLAQGPRAGDVPDTGPVILPGLDTIDVTPLGGDWFGLNHSGYADKRNVLNDLASLLKNGLRPPNLRTAEIRGRPEGQRPPVYWRYADV